MDGRVDETVHVISLCRFENTSANRRYKGNKLNEIINAICAMLNSDGGNVLLHNECDCEKCKSSEMSLVVRMLEQSMISIIGLNQTVSNIDFKEDEESIVILVKKSDSLITTNYNLYLPSQTLVVQMSPLESLDKVVNRNVDSESVQPGSHQRLFCENKMCELKHLKAGPSKRTTLADRMTGKSNKFSCYVSAFANRSGGHIYYGIRDDGVVEGELIPNADNIEITNKVEKAIKMMIWPQQIGQPKRGVHWEIFFEPVLDQNSKPIPSTYVIVIYIAACLGGVFTEEPECYEMVEGKVNKMSFTTWKKAILRPEIERVSSLSTTMDGHVDESSHVLFLDKFKNNKRYKGELLQEIIAAICAMLNSNGGNVVIHIKPDGNIPVGFPSFRMSSVIRILEQSMISIIGSHQTVLKMNFKDDKDSIVIFIKKTDSLITTNYNLYLPSKTQVVQTSSLESLEKVKDDIMNRKDILEPVQLGSHCKIFVIVENCGFHECETVQLKNPKVTPSKRTTLADRMTGKGNKFSCYVAAFANYNGGHIYYGITDDGVVEGEVISNEDDRREIIKKVEKVINKMIWPEQIGQPKRGVHWEIFFEPVVDKNSKPIPSTFVIVIYIVACLGGVFTEEPECYEMVDGKVEKMSFTTWKNAILHPVWLRSRNKISRSVPRISWSSAGARKTFIVACEKLRQLVSDGDWNAFLKECSQILQGKSESCVMKLLVLSKQVTACYRRGSFEKARIFLEQYNAILPQAQDRLFFEVIGVYLQAALKRASGNFEELLELLTEALSKAELIEPGLVTATVYVFAATVTDLINAENQTNELGSPDVLSIRALEHLQCVPDSSGVLAEMEQKAHITLATFYLGCNISGRRIKGNVDNSCLDKAKTSTQ